MTRLAFVLFVPLLAALLGFAHQSGDPPSRDKADAEVRKLAKHLRSHLQPAAGPAWNDFSLRIVDRIDRNEYATGGGWEEWADGKPTPYVTITRGYLKLVPADRIDSLALLVGRELTRIHRDPAAKELQGVALDRETARLLLRAGYSVRDALAGFERLPDTSRPPWLEGVRKLLDDPKERLWREMTAYATGLAFLAVEHHDAAIRCLEMVAREFPSSPEAWASLGYARLRHATPVMNGFEHVLGLAHDHVDVRLRLDKYWFEANRALEQAEKLEPGQVAVLANLGLAHLFPIDELIDDDAGKHLLEARKALETLPVRPEGSEIELLVNSAVFQMRKKQFDEAMKLLDEAEALANAFHDGPPARYTRAITFNRACIMAAKGKASEAATLFIRFLQTTPREDRWWSEGYNRYKELCKRLEAEPMSRDMLRKELQPTSQSLSLASGLIITPGEEADPVLNRLPRPRLRTSVGHTDLQWLHYDELGFQLCVTDDIHLVVVTSARVEIPWPRRGPDGRQRHLRIGTFRELVEELPGGREFVSNAFAPQSGTIAYYPAWRMAIVYDRPGPEGVVSKVILAE
jgi:tetratricopeptide (TPR) repeat protein